MTSIFVTFFVLNIPELLKPYAKLKWNEKKAFGDTIEKGPKVIHPFNKIDYMIED